MVEAIIPMLEMKVFLPEDQIIRQGEEGKEMFFISTGDCVVSVRDTQRVENTVRLLGRSNFFGVNIVDNSFSVGNFALYGVQPNRFGEE